MAKVHLITGGNGFFGNLVARRLLEQGERVRVLDVWDSPDRPTDIEFVHCDILDSEGVAKAMQGVGIVHHNAALVPLTKSGARFAEVNEKGSRIAAEEAARAGCDAFIHVSSSAIFGKPECPVTLDTAPAPFESYGRSKLAGEIAAADACRAAGLPLIVIRPRTILGEGRLGIFRTLFEWIAEGRKIWVPGGGGNILQFVHARDLCDFYMHMLARQIPGFYNVGAAEFGTLRDDLGALCAHAGSNSRVCSLPVNLSVWALRALDVMRLSPLAPWHYETYHLPFWFDPAPLLATGWQPQYSNIKMMTESFDWFMQNRDHLRAEKNTSPHRRPMRDGILDIIRRLS